MYCGQCGTHNNEEAGYCETCGAPLLISAGARKCATCGSSLGDHDRFCPTCGASTEDAGVAAGYDVSDDFGELDIGDIEISDLPDWLQEMAPQDESPAQTEVTGQASPNDLPDWLRDSGVDEELTTSPTASHGPAEASGVDHQPADHFSLVTDEDLPEWLRALGDEEPEEPVAAEVTAQPQAQQTNAVATLFDVPPINRAWLTRGRQVDESQVSLAQQEFSPLEIVAGSMASAEAAQTRVWDAESQPTEPFEVFPNGQESEDGMLSGRGRKIAGIAVLAFLVVVTIVLAFILLQGMA